jgi:hypothetical protein
VQKLSQRLISLRLRLNDWNDWNGPIPLLDNRLARPLKSVSQCGFAAARFAPKGIIVSCVEE